MYLSGWASAARGADTKQYWSKRSVSANSMAPLVSILIPAFNAEKWIDQTIQSALDQTWPRKELIIVDDGSRDGTLSHARRYACGMVKVASQQNRGASAARNHALALAQGDYIQWLDADDILASDKISLQLLTRQEERRDRTLLSSGFGEFFFEPQKARFTAHDLWQDRLPVEWITVKFLESTNWMVPCTWLVNRELTNLAGPWDERLSLDDDGEYFCRLVSKSEHVMFISGAKSYYRMSNMSSVSKGASHKAYESLLLSTRLCLGYLRALEDSEKTRSACLSYLQSLHYLFYAENAPFALTLNSMAEELGGRLTPPTLRREYSVIRKLFGWKSALRAKRKIRMIKLRARMVRERLSIG